MKVLGIDPGTRVTGFGIVEKGKAGILLRLHDGCVLVNERAPLSDRLHAIYGGITSVIDEFKPDCVAVETVFYGKNVKSAILLAHARGVALLCAAQAGLPVYEYNPVTIKSTVTGYGKATKDQVQKMVKMLLKASHDMRPDASDALAAAVCHIHSLRAPAPGAVLKTMDAGTLRKSFTPIEG